jgi:molybdopterin-guanine dinucleotide biosynthesis protein A
MGDRLASVVYRGEATRSGSTAQFSGTVLAGGRSRRMGFPKARLLVEGETLLHRQLSILMQAGASELLVSVNPACPESPPDGFPVRAVPDRIPGAGPMAGMEALLRASQTPWVLIVAVDLPRLTARFITDLLHQLTPTSGVVPFSGGRLEPLCAVYPRQAATIATRFLEEGRLEVTGLASMGIQEGWLQPWTVPESAREQLTNWNHPWELHQGSQSQSRAQDSPPLGTGQIGGR